MSKIKVGAVSYLNTRPLIYGVKRSAELMQQIDLIEEYPAKVAAMLIEGTIDVGLVPVAIIPKLKEAYLVSDFCIGATEAVASVSLFSEVPMEQIEKVLLDYQSRTSINLAKVLLKHYWKKDVEFVSAYENYQEDIKGTTAGVVIGDRALELNGKLPYIYDLAEAWIDFTGLPFVFATWVANKPLPEDFLKLFNEANGIGFSHLEEIVRKENYKACDLYNYYTKNISYSLDESKRKGLALYLQYLKEISV